MLQGEKGMLHTKINGFAAFVTLPHDKALSLVAARRGSSFPFATATAANYPREARTTACFEGNVEFSASLGDFLLFSFRSFGVSERGKHTQAEQAPALLMMPDGQR